MIRRGFGIVIAGLASAFFLWGCDKDNGVNAEKADEVDTPENNAPAAQNWPLFRRDAQMQGRSDEDLAPPLELAWSYEPPIREKSEEKPKNSPETAKASKEAETVKAVEKSSEAATPGKAKESTPSLPTRRYPIEASPVIADGVVFVGGQDGRFFAINLADGTEKWTYFAEGPITAPGAVFGDRVYFGDTYGLVYALDTATGNEVWKYETDGKIEGGVNALEIDGKLTLFIGSHDNYLHAIDASSGEKLWTHETDNYVVATPSIVASKPAIIFGGCDGLLHVVAADGKGENSEIEIGAYVANTSPVSDGIAYIANNAGNIFAIDMASGEKAWEIATQNEFLSSPALNKEHLIIGGPDKRLVAYNRITGEEAWAFQARRSIDSSPVICESAVWIGGMDGRLYAVDPTTGAELWQYELGAQMKSSPAISAQTLVICGDDGVVYGFRPVKN